MANVDGMDFMDNMEKLIEILNGMAAELEDFADKFYTGDEEIAELNAGKTQGEIELEDKMAAQIAAPLVNALDGISCIINSATAKVMGMSSEMFNER